MLIIYESVNLFLIEKFHAINVYIIRLFNELVQSPINVQGFLKSQKLYLKVVDLFINSFGKGSILFS